jgi:predicted dehydrogenase
MHPRELNYAMVGGGSGAFIGAVHRIAAALDGRARLVAGALSSTPERSLASGEELGLTQARNYPDHLALLAGEAALPKGERADFVSVVTPNDSHFAIAKDAMEAGFDVVVDKPMVVSSEQADELIAVSQRTERLLFVTYNYSGYPMVRQMRAMVAGGEIGPVRKVFVEYHQGWLATALEQTGQKQASWRTDPERAGAGGCLGDIGTHAEQLVRFVTGLEIDAVCADVTSFVDGRVLDDDASVLLRFADGTSGRGAKGVLTCSQVCVGEENGLSLRVHGATGSLWWHQERPNRIEHATATGRRILTRGSEGLSSHAADAARIPPGHPEGYLEAFANIYAGVCDAILARRDGAEPSPSATLVPGGQDGASGLRFVERVLASARAGGGWVAMES